MLLDIGEHVHVIERRQFDSDVRRHFMGTVERVESGAVRLRGHAFVYDSGSSTYIRSSEQRTRIVPFANGYVINVAPSNTDVESVRYEELSGRLTATDGGSFRLDINEFGRLR